MVIGYFCILSNDHYNKSSRHLSPHRVVTILLTILYQFSSVHSVMSDSLRPHELQRYTTYPCDLFIFMAGSLYILIPFTYFACPPIPTTLAHQFVMSKVYLFVMSKVCYL